MCTVIVEVPAAPETAVRVLAIRDEDPARPWDSVGAWWPDTYPQLRGVRDRVAGGAWMAINDEQAQLSVILNRAERDNEDLPAAAHPTGSRGTLVLQNAAGMALPEPPRTAAFNLVSVSADTGVTVTSFDGHDVHREHLTPGVHMIAHHDVNDERTARITAWLPEFQLASCLPDDAWRDAWVAVLARSAQLPPTDDRAIIRDNRPHGYPTLSLLVTLTEVAPHAIDVTDHTLPVPGKWSAPDRVPPVTPAAN